MKLFILILNKKNMEESIIQRIKSYLSSIGFSNRSLAVQLGMSEKTLNNKLNGTRGLDTDTLQKIALQFEALNINWLITGKGEMLKSSPSTKIVQANNSPYPVKPFIDSVYAVCGAPSGFSIAIKETECDGLSLPFMNEYDFSIKAKGDSMINRNNPARSIREGDIVACRLWKSRSHVRWGEVYALATSEGVVIKKLQESERNGFIKCVSFNIEDGFNPYDLPVEEIFDWAIVTGVVSARNWN